MIRYIDSAAEISASQLHGFFEGWANPPSPATHLDLLRKSNYVVLAIDDGKGNVAGFATAISDGVLSAYIPFLEVLPHYRGLGIGTELARRMIDRLQDFYMIDVLCDPELQPFYERLGLRPTTGAMRRNFERQTGL